MRVLIQRVSKATVSIDKSIKSSIKLGLLIFIGIEDSDNHNDIDWLCNKIINLRIFDDQNGIMNLSVKELNANILVVSQFTLMASTKKGNRPSYIKASKSDIAIPLYDAFCKKLEMLTNQKIETGSFGADMQIELVNEGPVTIWIDSKSKE